MAGLVSRFLYSIENHCNFASWQSHFANLAKNLANGTYAQLTGLSYLANAIGEVGEVVFVPVAKH